MTSADRKPWDPPWRSRQGQRHLPAAVADSLRAGRDSRGWSLRTAAVRTGVSLPMLSRLERGQRVPSTALAEVLVTAYQLGPEAANELLAVATSTAGRSSPYHTRL